MRTTKRRYEHFQFYNSDGIEEHLAKQAAGGWQLTKITPFTWKYKKTEPQALRYTVCYFSEASEFNPKPTENQEVFHEYCKEAGWDFVAQWAQMQIFCSANCDATPIETDERVKLAVIHGAMKKNFLPGSFAMIAISLLQIFMQLYTLADDPIGLLSNSTALSTALAWNILAICFVLQAAGYFAWYLGSKKSVEQGVCDFSGSPLGGLGG